MALEAKHHQWFGKHPNAAAIGFTSAANAAPGTGAAARVKAASPAGPAAKLVPGKNAPKYEKTGLAEFVPANQTSGLRLWNFPDGSAVIDANQQKALKAA